MGNKNINQKRQIIVLLTLGFIISTFFVPLAKADDIDPYNKAKWTGIHNGNPNDIGWNPDGDSIITCSHDPIGSLSLWDAKTGDLINSVNDADFDSFDYSPSGESFAIGSEGFVEIRDSHNLNVTSVINDYDGYDDKILLQTLSVKWSPDGNRIAWIPSSFNVTVYNVISDIIEFEYSGINALELDWSSDSKKLIVSNRTRVIILDIITEQIIHEFNELPYDTTSVSWSNNNMIGIGMYNGTLHIYDSTNWNLIFDSKNLFQTYKDITFTHTNSIDQIIWSHNGSMVTASNSNIIYGIETESWTYKSIVPEVIIFNTIYDISPDESELVMASSNYIGLYYSFNDNITKQLIITGSISVIAIAGIAGYVKIRRNRKGNKGVTDDVY